MSETGVELTARPVTFAAALGFWLKLGFISFGGPTGQIAILHQELVERRRWISEERFMHALNYCMVLPGPEAQQLATYMGWLLHGVRGGLVAGALFVLPSLLILIALSWIYVEYRQAPLMAGILYGVKPAVTAIVVVAAHRIGSRALATPLAWVIAAAAFVALAAFNVPFPAIVLTAGFLGWALRHVAPAAFGTAQMHAAPAVSNDHTAAEPAARPGRAHVLRWLAIGLAIWMGAQSLLVQYFGWSGTLPQMAWFFTKAALMSFGGAYALLPYVQQGAVDHYGWLDATQMIDGLALGETTPGPLIMIVAFVGFVGGWGQQVFGAEHLLGSAVTGAVTATAFTFLPSFIFILAGAPLVERTRGDTRFAAPLKAITAAVVGVILNLAVYFARHTFWPETPAGGADAGLTLTGLDYVSVAIALVAGLLLWRLQWSVLIVIALSAAAGVLLH